MQVGALRSEIEGIDWKKLVEDPKRENPSHKLEASRIYTFL